MEGKQLNYYGIFEAGESGIYSDSKLKSFLNRVLAKKREGVEEIKVEESEAVRIGADLWTDIKASSSRLEHMTLRRPKLRSYRHAPSFKSLRLNKNVN